MKYLTLQSLTIQQKEEILQLWNNEYPTVLKHESVESFDQYLASLLIERHILIKGKDEKIKGWCCVFQRNNETWFAMIIDSSIQKQGYGSKLLLKIKELYSPVNGWVITKEGYVKQNGEAYFSPANFYKKNGFTLHTDIILETDKIKALKISWSK
ncbi:hypothetical protein GCM10011506_09650 [Marivirga lumbricoides]|uniref:N-acetyltransferase domain-containing protein n=1 Tax=Marivirga lumbricoides TaxID=1046115 RepID=A0ABQ1LLG5_9BACT|nr:hypothetical protein GCM10011506_09650 [Marivirga lumbricoides]